MVVAALAPAHAAAWIGESAPTPGRQPIGARPDPQRQAADPAYRQGRPDAQRPAADPSGQARPNAQNQAADPPRRQAQSDRRQSRYAGPRQDAAAQAAPAAEPPAPAVWENLSGSEVLRGRHTGRVSRIVLSSTGSGNADGVLTVQAAFQIDLVEREQGDEPAPAPLQLVVSVDDGSVSILSIDPQSITISESENGAIATGTAVVQLRGEMAGGLFARTQAYRLQIVDPVSGTQSNAIVVEGPPVGPSWLAIIAALAALGAALATLWWTLPRLFRRGVVAGGADPPDQAEAGSAGAEAAAASARGPGQAYPDSTDVPELPAASLAAIAEGRGVLSIGTGCAGQAGLPTGTDLMRMLVTRFESKLPESVAQTAARSNALADYASSLNAGTLSRAMDVLLSQVKRDEVVEEVDRALKQEPKDMSFHELALAPAWRAMLSLAWDDLAWRAATATGRQWQRLRPDENFSFTEALRRPEPCCFDVVGQPDFPLSLSLSMEELRRNLSRNPEWQRGLALLMQSHSVLFIGTEPDVLEQFFQTIYLEPGSGETRHFVLAPMSSDVDFWRHSLARFGVELLPYGRADNHRAVREFLSRLGDEAAGAEVGAAPSARATPQISAISLRNIGPFESLDLTLATAPGAGETARPWTVIFGSNGMGKSTVLRAAALALIGLNDQLGSAGARLLRSGAKEGTVELKMGSESLRTALLSDGSSVVVQPAQVTPVQAGYVLVLGFPSLRGAPSNDPAGVSKQVNHRLPEPPDLLPLLHGSVDDRMGSFKQWLFDILYQAGLGDARATAQKDLLDRIIREIVPGDVDGLMPLGSDLSLKVVTADGPVPFDSMSQGMASIFNWLGVLVQRLYQVFPDVEQPEREEVTVLVDEIDAHLHPDWQRRLVALTKQNFPQLQVIATSHSPLLAGALHAPETCILERDGAGRIGPISQVPELFGQRSEAILTSCAFGLTSDRNPDIEALHREYLSIFQKPKRTKREEERMAALRRQLKPYNYGGTEAPKTIELPDVSAISTTLAAQMRSDLAELDELGKADPGGPA